MFVSPRQRFSIQHLSAISTQTLPSPGACKNSHSSYHIVKVLEIWFQLVNDFWLTLVNQCTNGTSSPIGCDGTNENREYREKKKQQKEIPCVPEPKQINECKKGMCWCRIAYHMLYIYVQAQLFSSSSCKRCAVHNTHTDRLHNYNRRTCLSATCILIR